MCKLLKNKNTENIMHSGKCIIFSTNSGHLVVLRDSEIFVDNEYVDFICEEDRVVFFKENLKYSMTINY